MSKSMILGFAVSSLVVCLGSKGSCLTIFDGLFAPLEGLRCLIGLALILFMMLKGFCPGSSSFIIYFCLMSGRIMF
jgi:hypothetical protein